MWTANGLMLLLFLLSLLNLWGFVLMGLDKRKAKHKRWRVQERTFFLIALFGGAAGVLLGMAVWRHKTRHLSFRIGIPALLFGWVCGLIWFVRAHSADLWAVAS